MQTYAPPRRRRSSVGTVIGILLLVGFLFLGLLFIAGIVVFSLARNEARNAQVMAQQQRAMSQLEQSRARLHHHRRTLEPAAPQADQLALSAEAPAVPAAREPIRVANREVTVELNGDGQTTLDGKPMEAQEFSSALRDASKGRESAMSILIKADKQCRFEHVAAVLDACQELDIPNVRITARQ